MFRSARRRDGLRRPLRRGAGHINYIKSQTFDLKHLIDLNKMKFLNNVSTSPIRVLQCCISQAMRSASVKILFYYYGVYRPTGCCVGFNTVFSKLKCALVV